MTIWSLVSFVAKQKIFNKENDFIIPPIPDDGIEFSFVIDGNVAKVLRLVVHVERRKGRGSAKYKEWEASLPDEVTRVELWSKNEEATLFWKAMGFVDQYELNNEDGSCSMIKFVF
jgi:hypothetical protein